MVSKQALAYNDGFNNGLTTGYQVALQQILGHTEYLATGALTVLQEYLRPYTLGSYNYSVSKAGKRGGR